MKLLCKIKLYLFGFAEYWTTPGISIPLKLFEMVFSEILLLLDPSNKMAEESPL